MGGGGQPDAAKRNNSVGGSSVASSSLDPEAPSNYNYGQRRRSRAVLYQLSGHYGQTTDKKALNKKIHNKIPANVSSITY